MPRSLAARHQVRSTLGFATLRANTAPGYHADKEVVIVGVGGRGPLRISPRTGLETFLEILYRRNGYPRTGGSDRPCHGSIEGAFDDRGVDGAGRAIVVFGQRNFPVEAELADLSAAGIRTLDIVSQDEGRHLGESVNRVGDLNGDGLEDLAIGASGPGSLGGEFSAGWLYVLFGGFGERDEIDIAAVGGEVPGFVLLGASGERHHLLGDSLAHEYVEGVGDVNGDGIDDLLVPAKGVNRAAGAVYVVYGQPNFENVLDAADPGSFGVEIRGQRENARFGGSISGAGDVNGDGLQDFIVGEPAGIGRQPGAAYLIYGSENWPERVSIGDPELRALEILPSEVALPGSNPRLFGWWVEGLGDWNEDGFADFAFGAPWQNIGIEKCLGRTYIVYGGAALPASVLDNDIGTSVLPGLVLEGHRPVSGFGMAGDLGDIDGDGRQDLLITASTHSELGQDLSESSVNILFRAPFDATTFAVEAVDPPGEGTLAGGDRVRIRGRGFDSRAAVFFGGVASQELRVVHSALIEALSPTSATEGLVDVEVRQGDDRATLAQAFRYRRRALRDLVLDRDALSAAGLRSVDIAGLGLRAAAADLNADGRADLVLSSDLNSDRGQLHIVFGRESWPAVLEEPDVTIRDEPAVAWFSYHFDASADIDGDGADDLVMGGKDRDAVWFEAPGRTYLLRGYGSSWPEEIEILGAIDEGRAVSFSSRPCSYTNPAFVHLPESGTRIAVAHTLCAGHDTVVDFFEPLGFETPPDLIGSIHGDPDTIGVFGSSLAVVGDMNGDGWPDLAVGETAGVGAAFLILGDAPLFETGRTVDVLDLVANDRAVRFTDRAHISEFGRRMEPAGDFNGDGLPDMIISAEFGGFQLQGRSYVVFGTPELGTTIRELDLSANGPTHVTITGEQSGDTAGYGQGIGDVNGDGYSDVAILGSYQDSGMSKVHVVLGQRDPPSAIDLITLGDRGFKILAPEGVAILGATASNSNISIVGADLDGDGHQDLAIPYRSGVGEGIFVIFGPIVSQVSASFVRGNANDDASVDISDAVSILGFLFLGDAPPRCLDAADTDDDGVHVITDAVYLLAHLFIGGPAPPPPFPEPGTDLTADALDCAGF
jgi:hypothetical protein